MGEIRRDGNPSQFFDDVEADWNLDVEFIWWLNKQFKVFKERAGEIVDLEFYKFDYNGEELTQLQIIDRVIDLTEKLKDDGINNETADKYIDEVFALFRMVFYTMWW